RRAGGRALAQGMRCGAFADEVVVDATQAVRVPPELSFTTACLLGCAVLTGMGAVERVTRVQPGDAVAVLGAGGGRLRAAQGPALAGAASITPLDVGPGGLGAAGRFGATQALAADDPCAAAAVRDLTDGGADHVVVAAGPPEATELGLQLARRGGVVVAAGMP